MQPGAIPYTNFLGARVEVKERNEANQLILESGPVDITFTVDAIFEPLDNTSNSLLRLRRLVIAIDHIPELASGVHLAGPFDDVVLQRDDQGEAIFRSAIYYRLLANQKEPLLDDGDALFPETNVGDGMVSWRPAQVAGVAAIHLDLDINQIMGQKYPPGPVIGLRLQVDVPLQPLTTAPVPLQNMQVLAANEPMAAAANRVASTLNLHFYYTVPAASQAAVAEVLGAANEQLTAAREVWFRSGGVWLAPVVNATNSIDLTFINFNGGMVTSNADEGAMGTLIPVPPPRVAIPVFLVQELGRPGGGVTLLAGTNDAYVIMQLSAARNNRYLLAHEIGHVLGIRHPDGLSEIDNVSAPAEIPRGSYCSVMVPGKPNSRRNTNLNLTGVQYNNQGTATIGAPVLVFAAPSAAMAAPDPFIDFWHVIRDFPYDDGSEPSAPVLPAVNWWTASDIWNHQMEPFNDGGEEYADGSAIFNIDYTPNTSNPTHAGPNQLYVRLHAYEPLNASPVTIRCLASPPGLSSELVISVMDAASAPFELRFDDALMAGPGESILPRPGEPKYARNAWSIPAGLPTHLDLYAVAVSNVDAPSAVLAPSIAAPGLTAATIGSLREARNDVAQRSGYEQFVVTAALATAPTTLPWLYVGNPDVSPASISVDVRADRPDLIAALAYEWQGSVAGLLPRSGVLALLSGVAIPSGVQHPLRLRLQGTPQLAQDPLGVRLDVRFWSGTKLVSGFTYIVREAAPWLVAAQVMDTLWGGVVRPWAHIARGLATPDLTGAIAGLRAANAVTWGNAFKILRDPLLAWKNGTPGSLVSDLDALAQQQWGQLWQQLSVLDPTAPGFVLVEFMSRLEQLRSAVDYVQEPLCKRVRALVRGVA